MDVRGVTGSVLDCNQICTVQATTSGKLRSCVLGLTRMAVLALVTRQLPLWRSIMALWLTAVAAVTAVAVAAAALIAAAIAQQQH
jgi:hypothetical protein